MKEQKGHLRHLQITKVSTPGTDKTINKWKHRILVIYFSIAQLQFHSESVLCCDKVELGIQVELGILASCVSLIVNIVNKSVVPVL